MVPVTILRQTPAWIDTPGGELTEEIWRKAAADSIEPPIDSGAIRGSFEYFGGFPELDRTRQKCALFRNT